MIEENKSALAIADAAWNEQQINQERKVSPFPILTFQELQEKEIPERTKLLPWLSEGGLAMIYAPAGCGKTHFAQSLTIALRDGGTFLKWPVTRAVPVLYVDGEMAQEDFRKRWLKWIKNPVGKNELFTLSHEDFFEREEKDLNLGEEEQREKLKATIEQHPEIRVVIMDNLSCLFPTLREDKRDDWVWEVLPLLIWLRRRSVAVILLHHTGKGGDQRGTVARLDALNTSIKLKPLEAEDGKKSAFEMHFTKARDCYGEDKNPLSCHLNEDSEGFFIWVWQALEESAEDRLINLVEDSGGEMSVKEAAEAMDVTPSRISHLKAALIKSGKLVKHKMLKLAKVDSKVDS